MNDQVIVFVEYQMIQLIQMIVKIILLKLQGLWAGLSREVILCGNISTNTECELIQK